MSADAMDIRRAKFEDAQAAASLALLLWPEHTLRDLAEEMTDIIGSDEAAVFLLLRDAVPIGFAQCQLRHDYVEGTQTSPVGYLEGVFVRAEYRGRGYGRRLTEACEGWARTMGCKEFASDCTLDNAQSLAFHLASGFREAGRIICFTKAL